MTDSVLQLVYKQSNRRPPRPSRMTVSGVRGAVFSSAPSPQGSLWWWLVELGAGAGVLVLTLKVLLGAACRWDLSRRRKRAQDAHQRALLEMYQQAKEQLTDDSIPDMDLGLDLIERLRTRDLRPIEVLHAHQARAYEAHKKFNCLVEPITEAEEWALDLEKNEDMGPLYGIPISVKENLPLKGYDCAQGCAKLLENPFTEDCVMIKVLKSLGAVPFVRSNMPQLGSSLESSQPICGTTLHPLDPSRGPGGSSSGEAVLVATRSSPFGLGSDTGGSIRCPAALCGVTALKPSFRRVSLKGRPDFTGNTVVQSCTSPIARTVTDLVMLYKALLCPALWQLDPEVVPMPFDNKEYTSHRSLRIGYFTCNGAFTPALSCVRAVQEAAQVLGELGHNVVEWTPPYFSAGYWMNLTSMCGDGAQGFANLLEYDMVDPALRSLFYAAMIPLWIRRVVAVLIKPFSPELHRQLSIVNGTGSTADWWNFVKQVRGYKLRVAESWQEAGLDAVICPAFGVPALPIGSSKEMLLAASYTMPFNVLDYPAGVVPVTRVAPDEDWYFDRDWNFDQNLHMTLKLRGAEGLPVGVQVVTPTYRDETCLRVMRDIEKRVRYQ